MLQLFGERTRQNIGVYINVAVGAVGFPIRNPKEVSSWI